MAAMELWRGRRGALSRQTGTQCDEPRSLRKLDIGSVIQEMMTHSAGAGRQKER